jgi:hypothetical protein
VLGLTPPGSRSMANAVTSRTPGLKYRSRPGRSIRRIPRCGISGTKWQSTTTTARQSTSLPAVDALVPDLLAVHTMLSAIQNGSVPTAAGGRLPGPWDQMVARYGRDLGPVGTILVSTVLPPIDGISVAIREIESCLIGFDVQVQCKPSLGVTTTPVARTTVTRRSRSGRRSSRPPAGSRSSRPQNALDDSRPRIRGAIGVVGSADAGDGFVAGTITQLTGLVVVKATVRQAGLWRRCRHVRGVRMRTLGDCLINQAYPRRIIVAARLCGVGPGF